MNKIIISIEGNIGVGKSTFIKIIKKLIENSDVVDEPVNRWLAIKDNNDRNILQAFYDDKTKYGYVFQHIAYISRMMYIEDKLKSSNDNKIIFLDRSMDTDKNIFAKMLYDDGFLSSMELTAYEYWCNFYTNYVRNIGKKNIIYLYCDPQIAFERIKKRNRKEELEVPFDYINKIHQYHETWMTQSNKENNILVINCNIDFEHDLAYQYEIIEIVKAWISNIN